MKGGWVFGLSPKEGENEAERKNRKKGGLIKACWHSEGDVRVSV